MFVKLQLNKEASAKEGMKNDQVSASASLRGSFMVSPIQWELQYRVPCKILINVSTF